MRRIRIASTSFLVDDRPHTVDANLARITEYAEKAAEQDADVVCFPEMVVTTNCPAPTAQPVGGTIEAFFSQLASHHRIGIIAPYLCKSGRRLYDQATVFDKDGSVRGFYRKVQPTADELRSISAGSKLPVIETSFGRVAILICLDMAFPEICRIYAMKGADIIFWPTVSHGPTQEALRTQIRARALDNSVVMVESNLAGQPPYAPYAGRHFPATARIVDHNGDILAQTGRRHGLAVADVDLDEIRQTSQCVFLREPDHIRQDLASLARWDLYASEYSRIARSRGGRS
jgi:predicted amidohydrolase